MKMVKSLLLGTAAGLVAIAGAQAADLPVKAKPVQYVKICSLYGAGFYYIPGTDTCIKVGGFVRAEIDVNSGGSFSVATSGDFNSNSFNGLDDWRSRAGVTLDTRSQTEYGTLRSYFIMASTSDNSQSGTTVGNAGSGGVAAGINSGNPNGSGRNPYTRLWSNAAFIQFAGFTAGKTGSFFDFDLQPYSNQTNFWGSNLAGGGVDLFAYTAQFGNGMSASIAAEDANGHRISVLSTNDPVTTWGYGNQQVPDIVGNLRIDQTWGSAQVMGAYHQINGNSLIQSSGSAATGTEFNNESGWAFGAGAKVNLPSFGRGDYAIVQFTASDGATLYSGSGMAGGFNLTSNNLGTTSSGAFRHAGVADDATIVPTATGFNVDKTRAWSVTGGFEHFWSPQWKSSIYGAYGELRYSSAASAVLKPGPAAAGTSANWNYTQIGSRTTFTPVANLDLSLEVMYNRLNSGWVSSGGEFGDKEWVSGIFRVQRNFYP